MLSLCSPAALNSSLQPLGVFIAAVDPVIRSHRQSGPAADPFPAPHSPPHVQPVTVAGAVPQTSARAAHAVVPPQPSEQARPQAPLPPPDSSSDTERAATPIPTAVAAASSTPAPGLAPHPIALSRAEYHARSAPTHPPRGQKCGKAPTPPTSQDQQPESAGAEPEQYKTPRPTTPSLPAPTPSQTSVASGSSSTTIAPAQKSPKPRESRLRKRRTEDASPPAVSVAKLASTSGEVVPHPATRAATKPTTATSFTACALSTEPLTTVPKLTSSASHADLQQFTRPPSRESSESPRHPLQIAEPQARGDRTPTRRNRPTALPGVTSSAEPVIVLEDEDSPPEHVFEPFEREEGALDEPAQNESARDTAAAATALSRSPPIPVPAPVTSVVTVHAPLLAVTSAPNAALPSRVTLATTAAISSSLVRAATTVVTAAASASRALTRSSSPNRLDSESWDPSSPIHPLV